MEYTKEFISCFSKCNASESLLNFEKKGVLEKIIPQVAEMKVVGECKYHKVNCFEHSINALKEYEVILSLGAKNFFSNHLSDYIEKYLDSVVSEGMDKRDVLKVGILLHDIGKPASRTVDVEGRAHFRGHDIIGASISSDLLSKKNLDKSLIDLVCKYVRHHMVLLQLFKTNDLSKKNLYEIFEELQDDTIGMMILGYVDIISTRRLLDPKEDPGILKVFAEYVMTNYIYFYKQNSKTVQ
ncbi:HD domain-containing protein [Clostridioides mangenotii]|uniref:HD domain-containing protein n=1 Tax=Metaclostridioides mangenotii TaxID=1540 RepID=UPI001C10B898|nr:HD domain-containing protein [Clostridioides mangenotii]MBU5308463.1 HD domain-containing protein [Clostridioides mangenotii]